MRAIRCQGGPADGRWLPIADPPPVELFLPVCRPLPAANWKVMADNEPFPRSVPIDKATYRLQQIVNPQTRAVEGYFYEFVSEPDWHYDQVK